MPTTFTLLRHAQGFHNVAAATQGPIAYNDPVNQDAAITGEGIKQATLLQPTLGQRSYDVIICSPLLRCRQTLMHAIPTTCTEIPVLLDDWTMEPQGNHICNRRASREDLIQQVPGHWDARGVSLQNPFDIPETMEKFCDRVYVSTIDMLARYPNKRILVVAHYEWIRAWSQLFLQEDYQLDNCEFVVRSIELESSKPRPGCEPAFEFMDIQLHDVDVPPTDFRMKILLTGLQYIATKKAESESMRVYANLEKLELGSRPTTWTSLENSTWSSLCLYEQAYYTMVAAYEEYFTQEQRDAVISMCEDIVTWKSRLENR
jgi:broad specificity phosphatase PhoE